MKRYVQRVLNHLGYRIERVREPLPGDQLVVSDYIVHVLNQRKGGHVRFVQIGANDGLQEDPCYAWIDAFPWTGILVEPQPNLAQRLRSLYADNPRIHVEQALIGKRPGMSTLYYLRESPETPPWATGIASARKDVISAHRHKIARFDDLLAEAPVPTLTLAALLAKFAMPEGAVDYLQIDAEGSDLDIIETIDFSKIRPAVLCYEHANLDPSDQRVCRGILSGAGYAFASWHGDTVACLPNLELVSKDRRSYKGVAG